MISFENFKLFPCPWQDRIFFPKSLNEALSKLRIGSYSDNKLILDNKENRYYNFDTLINLIQLIINHNHKEIESLILKFDDYFHFFSHDSILEPNKKKNERILKVLKVSGIKNVVLTSIDFYKLEKLGSFLPFVTAIEVDKFTFEIFDAKKVITTNYNIQNLMTLCTLLSKSETVHTLTIHAINKDTEPRTSYEHNGEHYYNRAKDPMPFFGTNGLSQFAKALATTHIKTFGLINVALDTLHPTEVANFISTFSKLNVNSLVLKHCNLGNIKELPKILFELKNTPIRHLNLASNQLEKLIPCGEIPINDHEKQFISFEEANGPVILENLGKALNHLQSLDLSSNDFGGQCCRNGKGSLLPLAKGLKNGSLKTLILAPKEDPYTGIGLTESKTSDEVFQFFSTILKTNPISTLHCSLSLHDKFSEKEVEQFGKLITESIINELSFTLTAADSYKAFLKGLGNNKRLRNLDLGQDRFAHVVNRDAFGYSTILELIERNKRIYQMDLENQPKRQAFLCGTHKRLGTDSAIFHCAQDKMRSNNFWPLIFQFAAIGQIEDKIKNLDQEDNSNQEDNSDLEDNLSLISHSHSKSNSNSKPKNPENEFQIFVEEQAKTLSEISKNLSKM